MLLPEIESQIQNIKQEIQSIKPMYFFKQTPNKTFSKDQFKEIKNLFFEALSAKQLKKNNRLLGIEVDYSNNVFNTPDQIKKFKHVNKFDIVESSKKPTGSSDYVGIEIECLVSVDRDKLNKLLVKHNLYKNCKLVSDGSIKRDEKSEKLNAIEITFIEKRSRYKATLKRVIYYIQ